MSMALERYWIANLRLTIYGVSISDMGDNCKYSVRFNTRNLSPMDDIQDSISVYKAFSLVWQRSCSFSFIAPKTPPKLSPLSLAPTTTIREIFQDSLSRPLSEANHIILEVGVGGGAGRRFVRGYLLP